MTGEGNASKIDDASKAAEAACELRKKKHAASILRMTGMLNNIINELASLEESEANRVWNAVGILCEYR